MNSIFQSWKRRLVILLAVFGPATITAMADNDAAGVATYSIAGATLGYPILFILLIVTLLLAVTQEMGVRLSLITKKGLGDLIREQFGVKISLLMFICLAIANFGTIVVDVAAVKTTSSILGLPVLPFIFFVIAASFVFVIKGNYKLNQNLFLFTSLFYLTYIFSAVKSRPDWLTAVSNLFYPNGVAFTQEYLVHFMVIGMGVLGTTITPWGQFFVSSFSYDKKIDPNRLKYSQFEAYWGAFLTNFFSFFMIVATAATLFVNGISLSSGEQAALAIKPFAGDMAASVFAFGILNAGIMGFIIVSLSTAYAFSEFFGFSGSLDSNFTKSKTFYLIFIIQILLAAIVSSFPSISLFKLAITAQTINAMALPIVFYYLLKLTNDRELLGKFVNSPVKNIIAYGATVIIICASIFTVIASFLKW